MSLRYIVSSEIKNVLDGLAPPFTFYWDDDGVNFTSPEYIQHINDAGGYDIDLETIVDILKNSSENSNLILIQEPGTVSFHDYRERISQLKTTATNMDYISFKTLLPHTGDYSIRYVVNLRYEKSGRQYVKYKAVVDDEFPISNPANDGWVEAEVWFNKSNSKKGLDWSGERVLPLEAGEHTLSLKIGRTSNKSVIVNYGFLIIEEV